MQVTFTGLFMGQENLHEVIKDIEGAIMIQGLEMWRLDTNWKQRIGRYDISRGQWVITSHGPEYGPFSHIVITKAKEDDEAPTREN